MVGSIWQGHRSRSKSTYTFRCPCSIVAPWPILSRTKRCLSPYLKSKKVGSLQKTGEKPQNQSYYIFFFLFDDKKKNRNKASVKAFDVSIDIDLKRPQLREIIQKKRVKERQERKRFAYHRSPSRPFLSAFSLVLPTTFGPIERESASSFSGCDSSLSNTQSVLNILRSCLYISPSAQGTLPSPFSAILSVS